MKQDKFQSLIRRLLSEELEKTSAVGVKSFARVPEMDGNGKDVEKNNKSFASDSNTRERQTKEQLLADLIGVVGDIDKSITVVWNDHDDLMVNARDIKFIRISPRWEDYYVIEMMTRNEDRVWVTGLNWEQVKDFVKVNLIIQCAQISICAPDLRRCKQGFVGGEGAAVDIIRERSKPPDRSAP